MEMSMEDFRRRSEGEDLSGSSFVGLNKTVFVDFADQIETFFCQAFKGPEDHFHGRQEDFFRDVVFRISGRLHDHNLLGEFFVTE